MNDLAKELDTFQSPFDFKNYSLKSQEEVKVENYSNVNSHHYDMVY